MHIPDGYLGPPTCLGSFAVMLPVWTWASSKVKRNLRSSRVPLLALCAAFCFLVMMLNVPAPGGTTGHAVGAALVAILMGPWAAVVAVSLALAVQAFVFGDGGVTAIAANCLSMAVVMPFSGWWTFRLLARGAPFGSRLRPFAAAAAGYVGLNAAALTAAILLGTQPALSHDATGRPLYCPFGLGLTVPIMMIEHLFLFGFVEAAVTGLAVAYLDRAEPSVYGQPTGGSLQHDSAPAGRFRRLGWILALLILLTPLGLLVPRWVGAGEAWGEWDLGQVGRLVGFVPAGMKRLADIWRAPIQSYSAPGGGSGASLLAQVAWTLGSAAVGAAVLLSVLLVVRWAIARKERHAGAA